MWKEIKGYECLYEISDLGLVRSVARSGTSGGILKSFNTRGYALVRLYKDNVPETLLVHRIVAEAFIPNPENKPEVNHKNGIKADSWLGNLEWATKLQNAHHAVVNGLYNFHCGEGSHLSKLTWPKVNEIRQLAGTLTHQKIAERFNVRKGTIGFILRNETWVI